MIISSIKKYCAALVFGLCLLFVPDSDVFAQDDKDDQSWNAIQINVPLNKQFDFFTKLTPCFGHDICRLNDGRHSVGLVWKPTSLEDQAVGIG